MPSVLTLTLIGFMIAVVMVQSAKTESELGIDFKPSEQHDPWTQYTPSLDHD